MNISISSWNIKMGKIPSVSLPAITTCRKDCSCCRKCYAARLEKLRPQVRNAYKRNLEILETSPADYWREVEAVIMLSRFFRFHVSGDIPDSEYFRNMVDVSRKNKHCEILCFTKKYNIVNDYINNGGEIPENLHLIFSGWRGLEMDNPHNLPEAHVLYKDGATTARPDAVPCGGNCSTCAMTSGGCWTLRAGDQVVFKEH